MEELGFVKNSDGNWTAQPLGETAQERGERVHKEMEEKHQKKNWYVDAKTLLKSNWKPKPQSEEEVEQGLRNAMRQAKEDGVFDEKENDNNFKNTMDLINEWGEKNKPPTLYQLIEDWWCDIFCAKSMDDMETCIDGLVNIIDTQFIPPSHDTNDYQWNKCLKAMRNKLR